MVASAWIGQRALQQEPSDGVSVANITEYPLPDQVVSAAPGKAKTAATPQERGIMVWKVTKTGTLQPRRIAFARDRRSLRVTSHRLSLRRGPSGVQQLWKAVKSPGNASSGADASVGNSVKVVGLHWLDRVDRGRTNDLPPSARFRKYTEVQLQSNGTGTTTTTTNAKETTTNAPTIIPEQCLTIVYTDGSNAVDGDALETLDLFVPNPADYELLVTSINDLSAVARHELSQFTVSMQLLHFHYYCLGKDWGSDLSLSEWMTLCERLQVPVKKPVLQLLFKEESAGHKAAEKLPISTIALLLDEVREIASEGNDPLLLLWKELVRTDPIPVVGLDEATEATFESGVREAAHSISAVALLSFMRSQQKQYTASLEQATELVRTLNRLVSGEAKVDSVVEQDRLTQARFVSWLTADGNDVVDPAAAAVGADVMQQPLSRYWIHTSHDTYLASIPEGDGKKGKGDVVLDVDQYSAALLRGVRCLELDVWDDAASGLPVVAWQRVSAAPSTALTTGGKNASSSSSLPLDQVFHAVRHFLLENPGTFPIILKVELHASTSFQLKMANLIYEYFGATKLLVKPPEQPKGVGLDTTTTVPLPTPESARGKVLILGKRPKRSKVGACTFVNDDLDRDGWQVLDAKVLERFAAYYDDADNDAAAVQKPTTPDRSTTAPTMVVVGFDSKGPLRAKNDGHALLRSPAELMKQAMADAQAAVAEQATAVKARDALTKEAQDQELVAAQLTQEAGMSPEEVKRRASKAAHRDRSPHGVTEEKTSKDEGLEVHEILPDLVEGNQDAYAEAAQQAMVATQIVNTKKAELLAAELAYQRAESDLQMSRQLEQIAMENAKKAAADARVHQEHADVALQRIDKVKELFRNCADSASSAGTVVQTAQTEANISKKRAAEAEGRAARAQMTALKDRERADDETRKEEELEQEVSELHMKCQEATEASQAARVRLDKANAMFERVNEQIKLIEKSTQYRKELAESNGEVSSVRHGGSFLAKHEVKLEERNTCRELIKEATEERSVAETRLVMLKGKFEEKARTWRVQANVALQARRTADRSAHVAEDLAEHAEEEREAAQLRQTARERAVETVENRSLHRESVEAQLAEAERAAAEAADLAAQSRHRAQRLEQEIEKIGNHSSFIQSLELRKQAVAEAQKALDEALEDRRRKERQAEEEKRRLDTNSSVYRSAAREAATAVHRVKVVQVLQQEAIVAYNSALMLRKQADAAAKSAEEATAAAEEKQRAAEHAKEYQARMDMLIEMPVLLAKLTLLHSAKFIDWERSHASSCLVTHSFAQNVLLEMLEAHSEPERDHFVTYTRDHLCRVFPSWKVMPTQTFPNCDPVLAWSLGCQMVGMNFQSADENLLVADGRFRQNGSCGYVLKPRCLTETPAPVEHAQTWTFQVLGAYNLPKIGRKAVCPRVRLSLYSGSTTETRKMFKTPFTRMNGLNPSWGGSSADHTFTFHVTHPSLAMLAFSVWDQLGDKAETFVAGAAFPASCLREGYRSVALFRIDHSRMGSMRYTSLLIRVTQR
jgi:Phosphatidylinositol-specific phospholipase C, X domain/Phosphatidylinositol-specific phospholipase C, Y domain/C2 domain